MRNIIEDWILRPLLKISLSEITKTHEKLLEHRGKVVAETLDLFAQGRFEELFQAMDKERLLDRLKMREDLLDDCFLS
ncbi:MAG: hypothetical protein K0R73_1042 [Candidatus Midichloriaceae bacterium]|jgi:hypothetical protein|nr:hypothetical protein [Candidatus Midichloriaceae bacterium]